MEVEESIRRKISLPEGYFGVTSQAISKLGLSLQNCPAVSS